MILGIYGAGGLGREVLDAAKSINERDSCFEKIVFINDFKSGDTPVNGAEVYTFEEFRKAFPPDSAKIVIAVGEPQVRMTLREKVVASGYSLQTLIHPTASVGTGSVLGDGVIMMSNSLISCNTRIGDNVFIQPFVNIGHDIRIGADSIISSFLAVGGNSVLGERVYVGLNAPIKENITIGNDAIIGMGAVVQRDIPENVIALGNPARPMKTNESKRVFGS